MKIFRFLVGLTEFLVAVLRFVIDTVGQELRAAFRRTNVFGRDFFRYNYHSMRFGMNNNREEEELADRFHGRERRVDELEMMENGMHVNIPNTLRVAQNNDNVIPEVFNLPREDEFQNITATNLTLKMYTDLCDELENMITYPREVPRRTVSGLIVPDMTHEYSESTKAKIENSQQRAQQDFPVDRNRVALTLTNALAALTALDDQFAVLYEQEPDIADELSTALDHLTQIAQTESSELIPSDNNMRERINMEKMINNYEIAKDYLSGWWNRITDSFDVLLVKQYDVRRAIEGFDIRL